ncbi:MAG: hypothetical protein PF487_02670 [Bacteroidales bacterium]|jgi:hypothetical protein|nr:hypothetical protein [Bacteroidales bacterium]
MILKNYLKVVLMSFTIVLFFTACDNATKKDDKTNDKEKVEATENEGNSSTLDLDVKKGKVNEDMLIEVYARLMYIPSKYADELENATSEEVVKISDKMAKEMENVYKDLGVTEEEIDNYTEKMGDKKSSKLMLKVNTRVAELAEEGK